MLVISPCCCSFIVAEKTCVIFVDSAIQTNRLVGLPSEGAAYRDEEKEGKNEQPRLEIVDHKSAHTKCSTSMMTIVSFNIPSVSLARPPVGWHKIVEQPAQTTTPWAWLKTVVIL